MKTEIKNKNDLTHIELEVLRLMAQDFTTNEIAEKVHITPMAVKMRIMKLKQKRGIRTHAALLCKIATTFIL
jgi:DNA-binding CsgD family transcriptional regulator